MNNKSEQILALLHAVRDPACPFESLHQLSQASCAATQDELEWAVRKYIYEMLAAWVDVAQVKIAAQELRECGGMMH